VRRALADEAGPVTVLRHLPLVAIATIAAFTVKDAGMFLLILAVLLVVLELGGLTREDEKK
jgi:hypothetical protein